MLMDSQGYPSQPSYVYVMWLFLTCRQRVLVCSLCRKNLGIASAGTAGLKELVPAHSGTLPFPSARMEPRY